jgi:hypothetical protein
MRVLSQITENRKVEARKSLIFRHTIFTFGLKKATLRQNRRRHCPDAMSATPTLRPPALSLVFRPNSRSGCASLLGTPTPTTDGVGTAMLGNGTLRRQSQICDTQPRGKPPLGDASLDRRLQNAYKSLQSGEALRTRGATRPPGTRAARRGACVRRTPHWTRRDCHAVLRQGRRPHPL